MRTAKQLSVSLVNKPGRLASMLNALAKKKVKFLALCVMDSGNRGTVRFIPDNLEAACQVLQEMNVPFEQSDVLVVEVAAQPGAFRRVCERLAAEHLNIDYAYCSFGGEMGTKSGGLAVIRVNDLAKAQKVLSDNGQAARRRAQLPVVKRPRTSKRALMSLED
ncbi:MAG: hypothetical protein NZ899_09065 [Thermoguttaceae bacterium]|nr:hypothetical protein [Thermoguttaceae bacterium]MDW8079886.1 hypothetical protein [Thermoguttaceae bacterium]